MMGKKMLGVMLGMVLGAGLLVSCNKAGQTAAPAAAGSTRANYKFTMMIYGSAGNPFWAKVIKGAEEESKILGVATDVQFADNDPVKGNNLIEAAVANAVDGLGVTINMDDAYDGAIKKAMDAKIPVIAFNVDDSLGAKGNARMAYIGQELATAGYLIAKRLIEGAALKAGDFVVCPVESPEATYAQQRYAGAKKAFDEIGIKSEMIKTGAVSLEETLNTLTQYLLGHKDTKAVLALGGMPAEMTPQACQEAGLKIPNAGFDLTKAIAQNVLDGKTLAVIDQQPYYQGALTVMQLFNYKKYGLLPCDINTGGAIITKDNAAVILPLADTVR